MTTHRALSKKVTGIDSRLGLGHKHEPCQSTRDWPQAPPAGPAFADAGAGDRLGTHLLGSDGSYYGRNCQIVERAHARRHRRHGYISTRERIAQARHSTFGATHL